MLGKVLFLFIVFNCLCVKVVPTLGFFSGLVCLFVLGLMAPFNVVKHLK